MSQNTAMAISLSIFGALATYLFIAYGGSLSLWAAFVAWACFFHSGGGSQSAKLTIAGSLFGCALGWATMYAITGTTMAGTFGLPLWAAMCVAVSAPIAVLAGRAPMLSVVPVTMNSLACVAAFVLLKGEEGNLLGVTASQNAFINISISMLIGVGFGLMTERLAIFLMGSMPAVEPEKG